MIRNLANQKIRVRMFTASGKVTGQAGTLSMQVDKDGGGLALLTDTSAAEIGTSGIYEFGLTQAETDAYELFFVPSSSNAAYQMTCIPSNVIYTSQPGSGVGQYAITIEVEDEDENPIPATVTVRLANGDLVASALAGTDGIAVVSLDAGDYVITTGAGADYQADSREYTVSAVATIAVTLNTSPAGEDTLVASTTNTYRLATATDWIVPFTIGSLSGVSWGRILMTIKQSPLDDTDAEAIAQVQLTNGGDAGDGLIRLNGSAPSSAALGSIVITNASTGEGYARILAGATDAIAPTRQRFWDLNDAQVAQEDDWREAEGGVPPLYHYDVKRLDGSNSASPNRDEGYIIAIEAVTQTVDSD